VFSDSNKKFLDEIQQRVEEFPEDINALIKLGIFVWEPFHESEKAVLILKKAIELDPSSADALFWLSKVYFHDFCNYEGAKNCLKKALELSPERADCLSLMSSVVIDLNEPLEESIEFVQRSVNSEPDWPIPRRILIGRLVQQKSFDLARDEIEKLLELYAELIDYPRPNDPIDEYYETCVTGRCNPIDEEWLCRVRESIRVSKNDGT